MKKKITITFDKEGNKKPETEKTNDVDDDIVTK